MMNKRQSKSHLGERNDEQKTKQRSPGAALAGSNATPMYS
jgi:hypothetical protein